MTVVMSCRYQLEAAKQAGKLILNALAVRTVWMWAPGVGLHLMQVVCVDSLRKAKKTQAS